MSTENEGTAVPSGAPSPPPASPAPAQPRPPADQPQPPDGQTPPGQPTADHPTADHPTAVQPTAVQPTAPGRPPAAVPTPPTGMPAAAPPPPGVPPTSPAYGSEGYGPSGYGSGAAAQGWPAAPGVPGAPAAPGTGKRSRGGLIAAALITALLAGGVGGGAAGYWAADRQSGGTTDSTTVSAVGNAPADFKREPGTVAAVAAQALPSVVTIEARSGAQGEGGGTGTGFVYDKEGHILTNNHVVASAADGGRLRVTFPDGKKYEAEVVGRAQGYDVAVLKLRDAPNGLTPLPLGDSDKVAVGDATIAIGAPFGLSNTVTTGIVSAKNRPVASSDGASSRNSYMSALQTDASINPGNSGGPLLDARGAVIGINSAIQSPGSGVPGASQAGSVGLGFAIPVNQAKNVAEQLIKTGEPVYPVIGAVVNLTEKGEGARIVSDGVNGAASVEPGGPAAKAGLKPGDVIVRFGEREIDSGPTLISEIWTHRPGDKVELTYERGGEQKEVTVTLGERTGD
ncbi:trypsin-like peptidase domain-containing protein [Streptomyces sp. MUM 203J]|uniref:S1C family serine protease n=1 Tax=Streptomyces sp. MUM 203J TaxID=2791990 RepID=UPI001F03D443|nr:trypsin-like peptidase domain-containing protein [Streptomyces sp. MUM 203J]MCH0538854.1 trypsin-like peptidase domain-containing protein [Streptomyces sp. MUM 203J]